MKKTLVIKLGKGSKTTFSFPTNGQIIEQEAQMSGLGVGMLPTNSRARNILEAMTFYNICSPELMKENNLHEANWVELSYPDVAEFVNAYVSDIKPWINQVYRELDEVHAKALEKKKEIDKAIEKKKKG